MGKIIMVTGGACSGKSEFAENLCCEFGNKLGYLATAQSLDNEMDHRIELHKKRRGSYWTTYEVPIDIVRQIGMITDRDAFLLDCLTMLLLNLVLEDIEEETEFKISEQKEIQIIQTIKQMIEAMRNHPANFVIVTNEIGLGIVPENRFTRQYRDIAGKLNQLLASQSDEVYLIISGISMQLKGN